MASKVRSDTRIFSRRLTGSSGRRRPRSPPPGRIDHAECLGAGALQQDLAATLVARHGGALEPRRPWPASSRNTTTPSTRRLAEATEGRRSGSWPSGHLCQRLLLGAGQGGHLANDDEAGAGVAARGRRRAVRSESRPVETRSSGRVPFSMMATGVLGWAPAASRRSRTDAAPGPCRWRACGPVPPEPARLAVRRCGPRRR